MAADPNRVSISKSALLLSPCLAWAAPDAEWYQEDKVDPEDLSKRDKGTLFHQEIHDYICRNTSHRQYDPDVARWLAFAKNHFDFVIRPRCEFIQSEVPIAINWVTGDVQVLTVKDRKYPKMPGYQFGTADLIGVLKTGELLIADWKTGGTEGAEEQLKSLACGFGRVMTDPDNCGLRKVIISCLQVNEEGVWPHETPLEWTTDLDTHWDAMRFQWEDIGKRNGYVPGIHCTTLYCPHLGHCGAISDHLRSMATEAPEGSGPVVPVSALTRNITRKPLDDREAGDIMSLVSAAKRQAKYTEERMKEYCKNGGRVLSGQYEWSEGNNGYRWRKA